MTLPQQDEAERRAREYTGLYELVERISDGYDPREQVTFFKEKTISVHKTEAGAYKAGLRSGLIVRPLKAQE